VKPTNKTRQVKRATVSSAERPGAISGRSDVIPEAVYESVPLDELLVCAVRRIFDSGEECTFERLVCEAFTLFPKKFGFQRYPHWPDSARVNKTWLRCRTDKGWIAGGVQEGFRLTPKGERVAQRAQGKLSRGSPPPVKRVPRPRERYEAALRQIRQSQAFSRFLSDPSVFTIPEMELRNLLGGTLETPRRILGQNLHYYLDAATQYKDQEALNFLEVCRDQWHGFFPKKSRG
jgi:hypothetical protein